MKHIRPFITKEFRRTAYNAVHRPAHPGAKATIRLATERFVWPGMDHLEKTVRTRPCRYYRHADIGRQTILFDVRRPFFTMARSFPYGKSGSRNGGTHLRRRLDSAIWHTAADNYRPRSAIRVTPVQGIEHLDWCDPPPYLCVSSRRQWLRRTLASPAEGRNKMPQQRTVDTRASDSSAGDTSRLQRGLTGNAS